MSSISDLEQQILDCWNFVESSITALYEEKPNGELGIALIGLAHLYQLNFEKLFDTFEDHCKEYHQYRKFYEKNQAPDLEEKR